MKTSLGSNDQGTIVPPAAPDSNGYHPGEGLWDQHRRRVCETLAEIPLFSSLNTEALASLARRGFVRTFPRNTIIIHEGDQTDSLHVILSGRVKVFLSDEDGRQVDLGQLGRGEYFGELAAMDDAPRSASVQTLELTRCMVISKEAFYESLKENPAMAVLLIDELSRRFRGLTANVKSLALLDVYGRVARTLLNLATEQEDGTMVVPRKMTQQELANMVGASREMVSRILKDLSTGGYVTIRNKTITIQEKLPPAW